MATEILVNDGGAPARIIPIACSEAVTAGDVMELHTDGLVRPSVNDLEPAFGVALSRSKRSTCKCDNWQRCYCTSYSEYQFGCRPIVNG